MTHFLIISNHLIMIFAYYIVWKYVISDAGLEFNLIEHTWISSSKSSRQVFWSWLERQWPSRSRILHPWDKLHYFPHAFFQRFSPSLTICTKNFRMNLVTPLNFSVLQCLCYTHCYFMNDVWSLQMDCWCFSRHTVALHESHSTEQEEGQ